MPELNTYEYGQVLRVDFGQDVSDATSYRFIIQPRFGRSKNSNDASGDPNNSIVRTGSDVTIGTTNTDVDDETYRANQFVEYTTKVDDLSHSGRWRIRAEAIMSATQKIVADFKEITVLD